MPTHLWLFGILRYIIKVHIYKERDCIIAVPLSKALV